MKKLMKKTINICLIVALLIVSFVTPVYRVEAQTLGDLKKALQAKEDAYAAKKEEKELTEKEKAEIEASIAANKNKIVTLKNENAALNDEIVELKKAMENKYEAIKKIINYAQISSGESSYLEYIFGAKSFTDFIYRASIAEQLSKYNKTLIDGYNADIKASEAKQVEIANKQEQIKQIQDELSAESIKLGEEISDISDEMSSQEEDIKQAKENIILLQREYNCSDTESIDACKKRALANSNVPASSGPFLRPIVNAIVTANYGKYDPYHTGKPIWHAAMDLAGDPGSKVYAAAAGKVVEVKHRSCGNNIVYIVHKVNGSRYTTGYWHLRSVNVEEGEPVNAYTVVGIQGGASYEDSCSTGQHLDFVVTNGWYKTDYFENPRNVSIDPRSILYFPPLIQGKWQGIGTSKEWTTR